MTHFKALTLTKEESGIATAIVELEDSALMEGDVSVAVSHSTINYKDGLAITGAAPVARISPIIAGIDFAGVVESSSHADYKQGDNVILNGWGIGEVHFGGLAQKARVNGDWLIKRPANISAAQSMAIGTAGYTAMLCVMAIEPALKNKGAVLVTGAAGGVGSVAIALLAKLGHEVVASTGRTSEADYLKELGASRIIERAELSEPNKRPLDKENYAAVIDAVGSHTLANAIAQTRYGGIVAACGLAQGADLPASVMPFILRGVTLCGIDSVMAPRALREKAWARLAQDLDLQKLDMLSHTHSLEEAPQLAQDILAGKLRGRVIIDVKK